MRRRAAEFVGVSSLDALGVRVVPHYGQTELGGGFCLIGAPGAGRGLLRRVRAVAAVILDDDEDSSSDETVRKRGSARAAEALAYQNDRRERVILGGGSGELVVLGVGAATPGYVGHAPRVPFADWRSSGDVFERVETPRGPFLRHRCRRDDVIVHATGSGSNPPPRASVAAKDGVAAAATNVPGHVA